MNQPFVIGIDMGGTKMLAAAINTEQGVFARKKMPTTITENNQYGGVIAQLVEELIADNALDRSLVRAVCLGVPGSVNPHTGTIGLAPNLNIRDYNIKADVESHLPFPVLIENDVNLAALGVHNSGVAKGSDNVLVVFVGTGIGGGIIIDKKIYRGSSYVAGEIGHMTLDPNGPMCGCGKKGCFEAYASRTAIVREITTDIKEGKKSVLSEFVEKKTKIKSKALAKALKDGDKVTIKAMEHSALLTGRVLANINNLMNFKMIVLGGGVIEANEAFMLPRIREAFASYTLADSAKAVTIVKTILGDDAALFGSIALAKEFLEIDV